MIKRWIGGRYEIIRDDWVVFQIIPDRTIKNRKVDLITRAFHELYKKRGDRISIRKDPFCIQIEDQARFSFRIYMTNDNIMFFVAVPKKWETYIKQKLSVVWNNATIKEIEWEPYFNPLHTSACTMNLTRHNVFSLNTDMRDQLFLRSVFSVAQTIKDKEQAMIDILAEPANKIEWEFEATKAYDDFNNGKIPHRLDYLWRAEGKRVILELIGNIFREIFETIGDFMGIKQQPQKNKQYGDTEAKLLAIKGMSSDTKTKTHTPPFISWIRVIVESRDKESADFLCRAFASTFKEFNADNELVRAEIKKSNVERFLNNVHRRLPHGPFGISNDRISAIELSRMIQMPEETLQKEFPQVKQNSNKEIALPTSVYNNSGIPLGYVTEKGIKRLVSIPVDDYDLFCIPHVAFGKMGTGKTLGQACNWALGGIKAGFSVFMVDCADGAGIDTARDSLPEDFPDDHIIDLDFGNIKYPIPLNLSDVTIATQADSDDELERRIVSNKLKDALVYFIKNISSYGESGFSDRMEEYVGAVGRAVLRNPENTLMEIVLALTNQQYLKELIDDKEIKENYQIHEILTRLYSSYQRNENTARTRIEPIVSRLNLLLNNEFAANLFLQKNKLDKDGKPLINFRKWADGDTYPYFVGIRIPKDSFGPEVVNRITAFVLQKWYLAILSRTNISQNQRKPCLLIWDEPHSAIEASGHILENMAVELRKYRGKPIFLAHGPRQFRQHWGALTTGGFTLSVYKTKERSTLIDLSNEILPFEPDEAMRQLPDRWFAINKISVKNISDVPAFMAEMCPPPEKVKDRSYLRERCSKKYGTYYKDVEKNIYERKKKVLEQFENDDDDEMFVSSSRSFGRARRL